MYHSRDIADLRADVRANCVIFLDLCKEAGLPVLVTETVRDDEYQRYLAANGYAAKTATRPTFHGVKAGLAFDICKTSRGMSTTIRRSSPAAGRSASRSAFRGAATGRNSRTSRISSGTTICDTQGA